MRSVPAIILMCKVGRSYPSDTYLDTLPQNQAYKCCKNILSLLILRFTILYFIDINLLGHQTILSYLYFSNLLFMCSELQSQMLKIQGLEVCIPFTVPGFHIVKMLQKLSQTLSCTLGLQTKLQKDIAISCNVN